MLRKFFMLAVTLVCASALFTPAALGADTGAKNVILLIGDGMGWWHVDAAHRYVNNGNLRMETLDNLGYMTTFMANSTGGGTISGEYWDDGCEVGSYDKAQGGATPWEMNPPGNYVQEGATDSAAAASALSNGHKTQKYTLNVVAKAEGYEDDQPFSVTYYPTIVDYAESLGKATGLVTSVNFNHATPAGFIVKTQYRKNYGEKARQMIYSDVDVIMGAGHPGYDDDGAALDEANYYSWSTNQGAYLDDTDGQALFTRVQNGFKGRCYVETKTDFEDLADGDGQYKGGAMPKGVFGLAQVGSTLQSNRASGTYAATESNITSDTYNTNVPSLETMTKGALAVLAQDEDGFFLMVEGGAIDWASHAANLGRTIEETIDFDNAVGAVIDWVEDTTNGSSWDNTLVIVTADHECGHLMPVGDVYGTDVLANESWGQNSEGEDWGDHTNSLVPVYSQGFGSAWLAAAAAGDYRDNTDIFHTMYSALMGYPTYDMSTGKLSIPDLKLMSGTTHSFKVEMGANGSGAWSVTSLESN